MRNVIGFLFLTLVVFMSAPGYASPGKGVPFQGLQKQINELESVSRFFKLKHTTFKAMQKQIKQLKRQLKFLNNDQIPDMQTKIDELRDQLEDLGSDQTFEVDCSEGETIGEALMQADPTGQITIIVRGNCSENLLIPSQFHNVTLDGESTATINGPDATVATIEARGKDIIIIGFIISGGRDGILISDGGTATIDTNVIEMTARDGVSVARQAFARIVDNVIKRPTGNGISITAGSRATIDGNMIEEIGSNGIVVVSQASARIANNTIQDVARSGVAVSENSSVRIGFLSSFAPNPSPNTIIASSKDALAGTFGIWVSRSSSSRIVGNKIMNFRFSGISINSESHSDIAGNTIDNNGDGIRAMENSGVNLGTDESLTGTVFNDTNTGQNNWIGLKCSVGGYVSGRVGTLNGNLGTTSFQDSCFDNLFPSP